MINSGSLTNNITTGYGATPTISISGSGGGGGFLSGGFSAQSINLGNLEFEFNDDVKKYEVYEISQDLLALSVCWARYRRAKDEYKPHPTITKLLDSELFRLVSEDDIAQANVIRDYYSKKIMVLKLKNEGFTSFREDLNTFIHSDGKMFRENMMPLAYRLPEFYDYDIQLQEMLRDLNKQFEDTEDQAYGGKKILKPMKKFVVKLRTNKFSEYWLKDDDNKAYKIEIPIENKLNHLWEHFFEQESIPLQGHFRYMERDGINYFHLKNWEIDFTKT